MAPEPAAEKDKVLQRLTCDQLMNIMALSIPNMGKIIRLMKNTDKLYRVMRPRMLASPGETRFGKAAVAQDLWDKTHSELRAFQVTTGYIRSAREWPAHKQTLRAQSFQRDLLPALNAYRQLGLFAKNLLQRGKWFDNVDSFAARLADFYATLLEQYGVERDDLVHAFRDYNVELLAWFQVEGRGSGTERVP